MAAALSTTALATPGLDDASAFSLLESDCWTKRKEKRQNFPKQAERVSVYTCVHVCKSTVN